MKLIQNSEQKIFFISDTHYNHSNICKSTTNWLDKDRTRDFISLDAMNSAIVTNINDKVGPNDILIHLGDWSFGGIEYVSEFRNRINCKNIHLILGNHDHHIEKNKNNLRSLFASVNYMMNLNVNVNPGEMMHNTYNFVLCHYPIASWNGLNKGVIHLHGHVHFDSLKKLGPGKMLDVGCDGNNCEPYSLKEVIQLVNNNPNKSLFEFDHHEENIR